MALCGLLSFDSAMTCMSAQHSDALKSVEAQSADSIKRRLFLSIKFSLNVRNVKRES